MSKTKKTKKLTNAYVLVIEDLRQVGELRYENSNLVDDKNLHKEVIRDLEFRLQGFGFNFRK